MRDVVFVIPGDLNTPTGGYRYDKRVMEELPSLGWRVKHVALPGDYPSPSERTLADTAKLFASFGADELIVVDGLALSGGNVDSAVFARVLSAR